jgi:glycosyltransferase involved in cell wall biosynthesis
MKKILIIAYPPLDKDPRPNRQIKWLSEKFVIDTLGTKRSGLENKFIRLEKLSYFQELVRVPLLFFGFYSFFYWDRFKKRLLREVKFDNYNVIIVHEIRLIPLALKISSNSRIILDAHEYSPENFSDQFIWKYTYRKYYLWLCKNYLNYCDKVLTVSEGIANLYRKNFNIDAQVINNASEYVDLEPQKIDPNHIKIIHHGNASPSRKLELMIDAAKMINSKIHIYLMLVVSNSNKRYYKRLKKKAKLLNNIHFIKPVAYSEIIKFCNDFDLGIQFHPPTNLNLKFGLGNKFFEFIQSRLGIIIGPAEEMIGYVLKYNLGIVTKNIEPISLANALNSLTSNDIMYFKENAHKCAKELSSELERKKLLEIITKML